MGFGTQLKLLLWKNFTLRKRQKFRLFAEIVFPLALFLILVIVRTRPDLKINEPECHYDGTAMPSAGTWPFLRSLICNADFKCYQTVTAGETAGYTSAGNSQSLITKILTDIGQILEPSLILNLVEDWRTISKVLGMIRDGSTTGGIPIGHIIANPSDVRNQIANSSIGLSPSVVDQLLNATISPGAPLGLLLDFGECSVSINRSTTMNATVNDVRGLVCEGNLFNQSFTFPTESLRDTVQSQLCNLSLPQFTNLYNIFTSALNTTRTSQEIIKFIEQNA